MSVLGKERIANDAGGVEPLLVRRAAVLGAGTMGSRIAAHLANAGIPVLMLDLSASNDMDMPPAQKALAALAESRPAALFEHSFARRISAGTFDDDLAGLADCDWQHRRVIGTRWKAQYGHSRE